MAILRELLNDLKSRDEYFAALVSSMGNPSADNSVKFQEAMQICEELDKEYLRKTLSDSIILKLLKEGVAERSDITRETVLNKMSKYHSDLGNKYREVRFTSVVNGVWIEPRDKHKQLAILEDEMKRSGYFDSYEKILSSFPIDFDKIRTYLSENRPLNRYWLEPLLKKSRD